MLVGVLVGMLVGVLVGVLVGALVGVLVGVLVAVFVGVFVGVLVATPAGVFVGVFVSDETLPAVVARDGSAGEVQPASPQFASSPEDSVTVPPALVNAVAKKRAKARVPVRFAALLAFRSTPVELGANPFEKKLYVAPVTIVVPAVVVTLMAL